MAAEGWRGGRKSAGAVYNAWPYAGRAPAPTEVRFEVIGVKVSKVGDKVIPEPLKKPRIDLDQFWAELDALGAGDFLRDGIPADPPAVPDPRDFFDK